LEEVDEADSYRFGERFGEAMKLFDRKQLWARLQGTILVDNFPLVVEEIDRAVRKALREERKRLRGMCWDDKQQLWRQK